MEFHEFSKEKQEAILRSNANLENTLAKVDEFSNAEEYFEDIAIRDYGDPDGRDITPFEFFKTEMMYMEHILFAKFLMCLASRTTYDSVNDDCYSNITVCNLTDDEAKMLIYILNKFDVRYKKYEDTITIPETDKYLIVDPLILRNHTINTLDHKLWNMY